ncbi:tetratricopeptide repeat protein [Mariprofundus erugo]|uniref:tetratricopeptide repeat protein n=1 Tax=Mariprofundus erugo TaxID=2528639 RepID=UPI001EE95D8A|nr:tetratricopeptide repeat protein [Mariprofundus erugo]
MVLSLYFGTRNPDQDPATMERFSQAESARHQGRTDDAIALYHQVLEIDPDHALALRERGALYEQQGKLDLAEADYSAVVQLIQKPDSAYAFRYGPCFESLARVLILQDKPQEAIEPAMQAVNYGTEDYTDAHIQLAHAYLMSGEMTAAAGAYLEAFSNNTSREQPGNDIDRFIAKGWHIDTFRRAKAWLADFAANAGPLAEAVHQVESAEIKYFKFHDGDEALRMLDQAKGQLITLLGAEHPACVAFTTRIDKIKAEIEAAHSRNAE